MTPILEQLIERQCGACSICGATDVKLVLDHNHANGLCRGALCTRCNSMMHVVDDGWLLKQSIKYRDQWAEEHATNGGKLYRSHGRY